MTDGFVLEVGQQDAPMPLATAVAEELVTADQALTVLATGQLP